MKPIAMPVAAADRSGDAEKSFWISFADLMTALMVLFLLVMTVTLLSLTHATRTIEAKKQQRANEIAEVMDQIARSAQRLEGIEVDVNRHVIDFGDRARFETASSVLSESSARALRAFVPELLAAADSASGRRWVRRVVVEGFADPRGSYLMNLNLSLQRGQRVLCVLLDPAGRSEGIGEAQQRRIRELFAVGGFSFNAPRESYEASRRIELRVEFLALAESESTAPATSNAVDVGSCALGR
jgi:outer membrane protein OmpA-like peptidoglycan-associated protein